MHISGLYSYQSERPTCTSRFSHAKVSGQRFTFLQKIRPEELNSLEDRAYHALLLTEVKDKNFIQQTEDSQIRIAVQYYDSIKDIPMQAKSYYYWGCIRRDQNNHPEALKKFFTAITHAQSISDNKLAGYIYSNIANLYLLQRLNEQADSIYQITERLAIQEKIRIFWQMFYHNEA